MPLLRAQRLVNSLEANTTNSTALEALIVNDTGRQGDLNDMFTMRGQCRRISASAPAVQAIGNSNTASLLTAYSKQFYNALSDSIIGLDTIGTSRDTPLFKIAANTEFAISKIIAGYAGLNPVSYSTIADVISTGTIGTLVISRNSGSAAAIANSLIAMDRVATSYDSYLQPLTANTLTHNELCKSELVRSERYVGTSTSTQFTYMTNTDARAAKYVGSFIGLDPAGITSGTQLTSNALVIGQIANTSGAYLALSNISPSTISGIYGNSNFRTNYMLNNINDEAAMKMSTGIASTILSTDAGLMDVCLNGNIDIWITFGKKGQWFSNTVYSRSVSYEGFTKPLVTPNSMIFAQRTGNNTGEVVRTTDGVNFTTYTVSEPIDTANVKLTYYDGWIFIPIVGDGGFRVSSNDGTSYNRVNNTPTNINIYKVIKTVVGSNTHYFATGQRIIRTNANTSPNISSNWVTVAASPVNDEYYSVDLSYEHDKIIFVGKNGACMTGKISSNTWTNTKAVITSLGINTNISDIKYVPASNTFVAVESGSGKVITGNGTNWVVATTLPTTTARNFDIIENKIFLSCDDDGFYVANTDNLSSWSVVPTQLPSNQPNYGMTKFLDKFYVGTKDGTRHLLQVSYKS